MKLPLKSVMLVIASFLVINCGNSPDRQNDSRSDAIQESTPDATQETSATGYSKIIPSIPMDEYLTEADIQNLSPVELREIRNEYYARRGYLFKDTELRERFESLGYEGRIEDVSSGLTQTDKRNIQVIQEAEKLAAKSFDPLTIQDFKGFVLASHDFQEFMEELLKAAREKDYAFLQKLEVEKKYHIEESIIRDFGVKKTSSESETITYSISTCLGDECLACNEEEEIASGAEIYRVSIESEFDVQHGGRAEGGLYYTFVGVDDRFKVLCFFAAG